MKVRIVHVVDLEGLEPDQLAAADAFLQSVAGDSHVQIEEPSDDAWGLLEAAGIDPNRVKVADVETYVYPPALEGPTS